LEKIAQNVRLIAVLANRFFAIHVWLKLPCEEVLQMAVQIGGGANQFFLTAL
jgi:hypothetical protein